MKVSQLLTDYNNFGDGTEHDIDIGGTVTADTCDLDLFVTFISEGGRRLNCSEMIAEDLICQKDFDEITEVIAEAARKTPEFERDGILIFPLRNRTKTVIV